MSTPDTSPPRRRSETSRLAILGACHDLVLEQGYDALTMDAVAARAKVGKQTIYRWWPSKGALAIEAFVTAARPHIAFPDTGDLGRDLPVILEQVATLLSSPAFGPHAAAFLAESVRDPAAREAFRQYVFVPVRTQYLARLQRAVDAGQVSSDVTPDDVLDAAFGPLWFRLLTRPDAMGPELGPLIARLVHRGINPAPDRDEPGPHRD